MQPDFFPLPKEEELKIIPQYLSDLFGMVKFVDRPILDYPYIRGGKIMIGRENKVFKFEEDKGIWLGNANFDDAPFRINMEGNGRLGIITAGKLRGTSLRTQALGVGNAIELTGNYQVFQDENIRYRFILRSESDNIVDFYDNVEVGNPNIGSINLDATNKRYNFIIATDNWVYRHYVYRNTEFYSQFNANGVVTWHKFFTFNNPDPITAGTHYAEFKTKVKLNPYETSYAPLKMGNYSSDPTTGDIGDLVVVNGIVKVCTAVSPIVWTVVGTQT